MTGRRVVVVGGGQTDFHMEDQPVGNGRAIALLLGREGATVVAVDRDATSAEATAEAIRGAGGTGHALTADVGRPEEVARMIGDAAAVMGGIDGVAYNVGVPGVSSFAATTPEVWDATLAVNLRGAMLTARAALEVVEDGSSFVFISSIAAQRPTGRMIAYEASKAGLAAVMRAVAFEGRERAVRANAVMLGLIDTGLGRSANHSTPRTSVPVPLGRQGTAWEAAYATLFLLSDEAAYITGQVLAVDGGRTTI